MGTSIRVYVCIQLSHLPTYTYPHTQLVLLSVQPGPVHPLTTSPPTSPALPSSPHNLIPLSPPPQVPFSRLLALNKPETGYSEWDQREDVGRGEEGEGEPQWEDRVVEGCMLDERGQPACQSV